MTADMMKRCAVGEPKLSKRETLVWSAALAVAYLAMTAVYVWHCRRVFHGVSGGECRWDICSFR